MDSSNSKTAIRAAALERRESLPAAIRREYAAIIWDRVFAMAAYREAASILAYCSFGSEINTAPLLEAILAGGKRLLLPAVNREQDAIDVYRVTDLDVCLRRGVFGIREPDPAHCEPAKDFDLVIVPGVAFDRRGGRIGYGKGYYDKLLAGSKAPTIAAAFDTQIVYQIPLEPHDVLVDTLVTEAGVIETRAASPS